MTPVTLGGIATVAGGALMLAVGVAIAQPTARILARRVAHQQAELLRYRLLARRHLHLLEASERDVEDLQVQVAEALQIIADLTNARLANADAEPFPAQVVVPPQVWAVLQEVREKPGAN